MIRILCCALLYLSIPSPSPAAIPRWDAVPAVDVMHLQGAYTGRTICPICQHGYDAGILAFLPSTIPAAEAGRIADVLRSRAAEIGDGRFRAFLILTGAAPSSALLDAVRSADSEWYVAHLGPTALAEASQDFGIDLANNAHALVFSQRRLLWAFDPLDETRQWEKPLQDYARYAMHFLQSNYPQPTSTEDPDAAKGRLWLAPMHLSSEVSFFRTSQRHPLKICFASAADYTMSNSSLVALYAQDHSANQRTQWARTDDEGCISLRGVRDLASLLVEVFEPLNARWSTSIDPGIAEGIEQIDVHAERETSTGVTGNEIVASLPCEGCEAIFAGLPNELSSSARIVPVTEPGEPLLLSGVVKDRAGNAQAGVILYAYQTDASGHYPKNPRLSGNAARHGRLRAWTQTGAAGRYTFQTIRPGAYAGRTTPQHIHMHVIEPGRCTYFVGDLMFMDDPRLTDTIRSRESNAIGGSGIVQLDGNARDGWQATRDIVLGLNLPTYGKCRGRASE